MITFSVPKDLLLYSHEMGTPSDFSVRGFSGGQGEDSSSMTVTVTVSSAAAGATQWTPAEVSTALWLDASDSSTITLSGSTVSQWDDKSGNTRHAAQASPSLQPTLISGGLNGLPVLRFDGSNDCLEGSAGLWTGNQDGGAFVVYVPRVTSGICSIFGQAPTNTSNLWRMLQFRTTYAVGDPYFAGYSNDLTDSASPTTAPKIGAYTHISGATKLYRNGNLIASQNKTLNSSGNYRIGRTPATTECMNGDIAEIIAFSAAVSDANRQKIEGYLAHKWGLTAGLPSGHPYKSAAPTL